MGNIGSVSSDMVFCERCDEASKPTKAAGGEGCAVTANADNGDKILLDPTGVGNGPTYSDTSKNYAFCHRTRRCWASP